MKSDDWKKYVQWRSLVCERPDTKREILCAYRGGRGESGWKLHVCTYYPDEHRIYVYQQQWLGDMIKRRDVHWTELPPPPVGAADAARE